jgi:hypothetical protein
MDAKISLKLIRDSLIIQRYLKYRPRNENDFRARWHTAIIVGVVYLYSCCCDIFGKANSPCTLPRKSQSELISRKGGVFHWYSSP